MQEKEREEWEREEREKGRVCFLRFKVFWERGEGAENEVERDERKRGEIKRNRC